MTTCLTTFAHPALSLVGGELINVKLGDCEDFLAEVGEPHPVPALAADQQLPLEVLFQVLELRGQRGGKDADRTRKRRQGRVGGGLEGSVQSPLPGVGARCGLQEGGEAVRVRSVVRAPCVRFPGWSGKDPVSTKPRPSVAPGGRRVPLPGL
jgi:hypothetical protein